MSYDINFWFPRVGTVFEDWVESFDGIYPVEEQHLLAAALDGVLVQARTALPASAYSECGGGFALDDEATAISFGYSPYGVSLSCPYRTGGGEFRITAMYGIAQAVSSCVGLQAYDPQIEGIAEPRNRAAAIHAYEEAARFAASLFSQSD
ncbi:hypothetical protein [Mycobacterium sp. D16Q16]|uniref:hypothetical protein n=1 Tax=Mycobacterium sp. D16Q16 TaxID=1855659 RepID=UPI001116F812|nr:hypothetical protein [Mycobacterium sp. D16Q16]